jgi:hypothetical protein
VLHHSERGWHASTRFVDLIRLDHVSKQILALYLVDFHFLLDDLTQQSDAQIHARALTELAEIVALAFKHLPYAADPLAVLGQLAPLMVRVMTAPNGLAALGALLNYAISVSDVELGALRTLVAANVGKTVEEAVMTTAERLHQQGLSQGRTEGLSQGLSQGRTEGHASALLKLLTLKFGALSQGVTDRVRSAGVAELDLWTERVLSAQSLDEVLR